MGATLLLQVAASKEQPWPIAALISISGGGFVLLNEERKKGACVRLHAREHAHRGLDLCPPSAMARPARDSDQPLRVGDCARGLGGCRCGPVQITPHSSIRGFRKRGYYPISEHDGARVDRGRAADALREPGYASCVAAAIPGTELVVFEESGHMPNIEEPERLNSLALNSSNAIIHPGHHAGSPAGHACARP